MHRSKTCSPIRTSNARGSFATLEDGAGAFVVNNAPFRFRDGDTSIRGGAPKLGEHTSTLLTDLMGLDPSRIRWLIAEGVVA